MKELSLEELMSLSRKEFFSLPLAVRLFYDRKYRDIFRTLEDKWEEEEKNSLDNNNNI